MIKIRDYEYPIMQTVSRLGRGDELITTKLAAVDLIPAVYN